MKTAIFRALIMLGLSAMLVGGTVSYASAAQLNRLSADYQSAATSGGMDEIVTNATPADGGLLIYSKTLTIPFKTVYITFSAQGDTHQGSALLMQASVTDHLNVTKICQPQADLTEAGGGGPTLAPGWMTLLKLPVSSGTNCNDGLGGSADCHDNGIMFSCCLQITPDKTGDEEESISPTTHTVKIKLADLPGFHTDPPPSGDTNNLAFYERSTIYIDATGKAGEEETGPSLCTAHGVP
jgi:hypothetical protein